MLDEHTKAQVRDAARRILEGRETVPGDLPLPPAIRANMLAIALPDIDPARREWSKQGRQIGRWTTQVYLAGYAAGRACDEQIGRQVRAALGFANAEEAALRPHRHVGVAVCLVCDQAPEADVHLSTEADRG